MTDNNIFIYKLIQNILPISVITVITLLIYMNSLNNDFVWDDVDLIVKNEAIRKLDLHALWSFFSDDKVTHAPGEIYRPLYILSYALNYKFFGIDPFGYHLTNLIIHTINSVLVFFVVSLMLNTFETIDRGRELEKGIPTPHTIYLSPAFASAILFATHPIHTESVTWVKGRDDPMAFFFMLLAFYFYIKFKEKYQNSNSSDRGAEDSERKNSQISTHKYQLCYYLLALFFYLCAIFTKEMAMTLPLLLFLYDFTMGDGRKMGITEHKVGIRKNIIKKIWVLKWYLPFFLEASIFMILRSLILGQVGQMGGYWADSFVSTMYTMAKGFVYYIKILILPLGLVADHVTFQFSKGLDREVVFSFFLLLVVFLSAIALYRYSKVVTFSVLWFFITLLPVSNLIPIKILIAERFLYIPSFGYSLLLSVVLAAIGNRFNLVFRFSKHMLLITLIIVVILYSYSTYERNKVWKDEYTLWTNVIERYPDSARAHTNLGIAYADRELFKDAAIEYLKAIEIDSRYVLAYFNLGNVYTVTSNTEDAIKTYKKALMIDPEFSSAHFYLGRIYEKLSLYREAIKEFKATVRIEPKETNAHLALGRIYLELGHYKAAVSEFTSVLAIDPKNKTAQNLLLESREKSNSGL